MSTREVHSCGKRLLPSSCLSVRLSSVSAQLPLDKFSRKLILETVMTACRENRKLVKNGWKYRALYIKPWVRFMIAGDINSSTNMLSGCYSVRFSVRIYSLGSHWTDVCEIWYCGDLWISVEKLQIWLKSGKRTGIRHEDGGITTFCCYRRR